MTPQARYPAARVHAARRAQARPAAQPLPRFLHRPILGGEFGLSGRYLLATATRVTNGLHCLTCMVLDREAGIVLAMADDKAQALASGRRAVRAAVVAERRSALAAAAAAGQSELWPEHGLARRGRKHRASRRRRQILEASGGGCWYCRKPLQFEGPWHVEHQLPRALDGEDRPPNLVASCADCNLAKRDRTAVEFVAGGGARGG